jgi:hypothetical protein
MSNTYRLSGGLATFMLAYSKMLGFLVEPRAPMPALKWLPDLPTKTLAPTIFRPYSCLFSSRAIPTTTAEEDTHSRQENLCEANSNSALFVVVFPNCRRSLERSHDGFTPKRRLDRNLRSIIFSK